MQCMKCGRDTEDNAVFCPECLGVMGRYPVKPGTIVQLPVRPRRERAIPMKKDKPEDTISRLQNRIHRLNMAVSVLVVCLMVSIGLLIWQFSTDDPKGPSIGQNYSTETYDGFRGR